LPQEWARILEVPLLEVSLEDEIGKRFGEGRWRPSVGENGGVSPRRPPIAGEDPWSHGFQATDLLMCGHDLPPFYKNRFIRQAQRQGGPGLLLLSESAELPNRILLIDQGGPSADSLLDLSAKLCEIFRAGLVALTVARTEPDAQLRQHQAWERLQGRPVQVNFDFVAGAEMRVAAVNVARGRGCQLVLMDAGHPSPWARWLGSAPGPWILDLRDSLSFLLLPQRSKG
jgi:hypothetical protein